MFEWIDLYREISAKLLSYEGKSAELVKLLLKIGITGFDDRNSENGSSQVLEEIDPFTFLHAFNKFTKERSLYLSKLKQEWGLTSNIPNEYPGVPKANAQNFWCFGFKF